MTKKNPRLGRINEVLHRELAHLIRDEFKDPRVGFVTISGVEVSRDLAQAKIYVTVIEDSKVDVTIDILNRAAGFFRKELAQRVQLRQTPQLRFIFDNSIVYGNKIDALINQLNENNEEEP